MWINYSLELKSTASSALIKQQAFQLYLEGLGFRSIGLLLGVSPVPVQNWIKKFAQYLEELKSENEIYVVELDEMHTYRGNKKILLDLDCYLYNWEKFIHCSFGSRGIETGQKSWEYLERKEIEEVRNDHWKAYAEFLPETIYAQSKAETSTVKGYNSIFRHFLARLRRRTK